MFKLIPTSSVLALCLAGTLSAQSIPPADQGLIDDAIRTEEIRTSRAPSQPTSGEDQSGAGISAPEPDLLSAGAGGPCFELSEVLITGWEKIGSRPNGADHLIGRCSTAADIGEALNAVNLAYQDAGLITTRAYLPQQDVSDGDLEITVIAGVIEGFVYGDGSAADGRLNSAFPTGPGDLLDLRRLEQGYDNLNGPASASAEANFIPGTEPGDSVVAVAVEDGRPWSLDATLSNQGQESTGQIKGGLTFGYDNLANLNDELSISLSTTPFENRDERFSDSLSLIWGVPVGNWSHSFTMSGSQYRIPVIGINEQYEVEGNSLSFGYGAEVLLRRDQASKVYATGGLDLTRSRSFIEGIELVSQRRNMSVGNLGLRGEHTLERGEVKWETGVRFGLDAFGANIPDASIVERDFVVWSARVDYDRPLGESGVTWSTRFESQISPDILPTSKQLSIGSWSTVRGFHEDSMYGDDGFYIRNTFEGPAQTWDGGKTTFNAGFDLGYINPSALRDWSQRTLVGVSVGADIEFDVGSTLSIGLAHAISRPDENAPNSTSAFEDVETVARIEWRAKF